MKQYLSQLYQCPLFGRIEEEDLFKMLFCLNVQVFHFEKGRTILHQGTAARTFGILLGGHAHVISVDSHGNHTIVAAIHPGDVFAESFACAGVGMLPVSVTAVENCDVLLLDHARVMTACRNGCMAHSRLVTNLMSIIARKNVQLNQKLSIITRRTTREKLMAYFAQQQILSGASRFVIPFDRQGLADYLGVERSAMSAELSKMKKAGLIDYRKNEFEMLLPEKRN